MSDIATQPLLDLDTLFVRPTVQIDGERYEILSPDELSVLDSRRFGRWGDQLNMLEREQDESSELDELVSTIARKVLVGVPDDVFAKLSGRQKVDVVEVFTVLLLRGRASVAGAIGTAVTDLLTGAKSSRGSSGSTAERPGSGWRTRLWRWFSPSRG